MVGKNQNKNISQDMKRQIQKQIQISVHMNEILLEPGHACSFTYGLWLLSNWDKDWTALPKPRIFLCGPLWKKSANNCFRILLR